MAFSESFPPPPTATPAELLLWRWGHRALWGVLGAGLGGALLLACLVPEVIWLVPLGLAALATMWFLFQRPLLNLAVVLFGFTAVINPNPGFQLSELLYALYYLAFMMHWYGQAFVLDRTPVLRSTEDRTAIFLLVAGLALSVVMGLVLTYPLDFMREEFQGFLMFAFYLPVKEACRKHRLASFLVLAVIVWLGTFIAIRNFLNYRAILLGATQIWEIADSRPGFNELHLTVAPLALLILWLTLRHWAIRGLCLLLFLTTFAGLLLTKSRAFWVAFALGVLVLFVLMHRRERRQMLGLLTFGAIGSVAAALFFLGDLSTLVFEGLFNRFLSLETATTKDLSLVNRFNEASAVWERIKDNPLLGYGLGAPYKYYSWVYHFTSERSYVHIGYVGLWYKFGVWGLVGMLYFWVRAIWQGFTIYWGNAPDLVAALGLFGAASLTAMTLSTITHNPFMTMDTMFIFTILTGMVVGLSQRYGAANQGDASLREGQGAEPA